MGEEEGTTEVCVYCDGSKTCDECGGEGSVDCPTCGAEGYECENCKGTGKCLNCMN